MPTGSAPAAGAGELPDGIAVRTDADADLHRFGALDETLRRDVPGAGEWCTDPEAFRSETFVHPEFDPVTYLIAIDSRSGEYAGLVRVWTRPTGPRLGLIGVLPAYQRRGLARALVARVLAVLHERGETEVVCEADETNVASNAAAGRVRCAPNRRHRRPDARPAEERRRTGRSGVRVTGRAGDRARG